METKLETPKEITEIGIALGKILKVTGEALQDGFQAGQDIPAIITSAIVHLGAAIDGVGDIPEEFKNDPVMATMGIIAPVSEGVKAMIQIKKAE